MAIPGYFKMHIAWIIYLLFLICRYPFIHQTFNELYYHGIRRRTIIFYLDDVTLSNILTIENSVKQIAPRPTKTRAGMK